LGLQINIRRGWVMLSVGPVTVSISKRED